MAIVKISDIFELRAPQEQTKILENQPVHGSSRFPSDSVKNSDSGSPGCQEYVHNTPIRLAGARPHMGHLQGWPFGVARLPSTALGIRVALRLLLRQPLCQRWLLLPDRSNAEWSPGTYVLGAQ